MLHIHFRMNPHSIVASRYSLLKTGVKSKVKWLQLDSNPHALSLYPNTQSFSQIKCLFANYVVVGSSSLAVTMHNSFDIFPSWAKLVWSLLNFVINVVIWLDNWKRHDKFFSYFWLQNTIMKSSKKLCLQFSSTF